MDMSGTDPNACKISMLWNWYTVNACFLASGWHVHSKGGFAGSVIGVFLMSAFLELIRRVQREYDYFLKDKHGIPTRSYFTYSLKKDKSNDGDCSSPVRTSSATLQITFWEHSVRSVFYILQFVNAYFIMLLAMYYNGYIIIAIFLGVFAGHLAFGRDNLLIGTKQETGTSCC